MELWGEQEPDFPDPEFADSDGILAVGGPLNGRVLIKAYSQGIFPWNDPSEPTLWWSPDPRMVIWPETLYCSKSMRQVLKREIFRVSVNQAFESVIDHCATVKRNGQEGTWISRELKNAFLEAHQLGVATSVEAWQEGRLVGGFFGMHFGHFFTGDSMFSLVPNASKAALISYAIQQFNIGLKLIDCQVYTDHIASLGGALIPRSRFLSIIKKQEPSD